MSSAVSVNLMVWSSPCAAARAEDLLGGQPAGYGRMGGRPGGCVRGGDRRARRPCGPQARRPQFPGEGGQRAQYGIGRGGGVHQHDRLAVSVRRIAVGGGPHELLEPGAGGLGIGHGLPRPQREARQLPQPVPDAAARVGDRRHGVQCGRGARRRGEQGQRGQRLMAGRPVAERVGELRDARRVLPGAQQGAHAVADPDHRVRGAGRDAGEQPRPPLGEDLAPGTAGRLPLEVRRPVGDAARVAQRLAPVRRGHLGETVRHVLELVPVVVQPSVHTRSLTVAHQRLDGHRGVIAQPAAPFRAEGVEPFQCLVERAGGEGAGGVGACGGRACAEGAGGVGSRTFGCGTCRVVHAGSR